ncbi:MAG: glycosyltransferase family 39 protein [Bacteroidia bacterium]|nr:glycosyltransferase family 39 protein [Bacteroidia bacterium]
MKLKDLYTDRKWRDRVILTIYAILAYMQVLHHLDFFPLISWDESLFGMRMLSIAEDGEYLKNFDAFQGMGHPNHKPPFITLLQVFFYKIFGANMVELAMRLPIALGTLTLLFYFPYFSLKKFGNISWGVLAGMVLLCSRGYHMIHIGKTGDHDAPLAVIMCMGLFAFYHYMEAKSQKERNRHLFLLSLSFLLAYLTKSVMAFFFVFGFIAYALVKGQLLSILKRPSTYIAFAALGLSILIYHLLLNSFASVHHSTMHFRVFRQFVNVHVSQAHDHKWDYYLHRITGRNFYPFYFFLPLGFSVAFNRNFPRLRDLSLLASLSLASFFLIISFSVTKLEWYDAALYPLLAMITASALYMLWSAGRELMARSPYFSQSFNYILIFLLFAFPYYWINSEFHVYKLLYPEEKFAYIMEQVDRKLEVKDYYLAAPMGIPHASFYAAYYNRAKKFNIRLIDSVSNLKTGEYVMACHDDFVEAIKEKYEVYRAEMYDQCRLFEIKGRKVNSAEELKLNISTESQEN